MRERQRETETKRERERQRETETEERQIQTERDLVEAQGVVGQLGQMDDVQSMAR